MRIEFVDRYSATGMPYPCPWTACKGPCEGMGLYPIEFSEWESIKPNPPAVCPQVDEDGNWQPFPPPDGWLFVYCDECSGAGRRLTGKLALYLELLYTYWYQIWWPLWAMSQHEFYGGYLKALTYLPQNMRFIYLDQRGQRRLIRRHSVLRGRS